MCISNAAFQNYNSRIKPNYRIRAVPFRASPSQLMCFR
nr:MAG TPA: hypothetical protein [Caudoviricetes sp.]